MLLKNDLSHKEVYEKDIEILMDIENILDIDSINSIPRYELKTFLENKVLAPLKNIKHPVAAEHIFGMALAYPNSLVRSVLVDLVKTWLPNQSAIETMIKLTRDPDDLVCFKAIEICGQEKIELGLYSVKGIIGNANHRINFGEKPVGFGAAKALKSMTDILGTEDPEELTILENHFSQNGKLLDHYDFKENIPNEILEEFLKTQEEGMILIPGGFFTYGIKQEQVPEKSFDWLDSVPNKKVWLPPFFIDKYPTTNQEYDEFVKDIQNNGHIFCHVNEPEDKDHTRNTFWDPRFKDQHPLTGIDWYDAFAYSRWKGKELPSEFQWEKAARGENGNVWPWGDDFNSNSCNWANKLLGKEISSLQEWRRELLTVSDEYPEVLVENASCFENPSSMSPYGVVGMVGNHWEWTSSDWSTRRYFSPGIGRQFSKDQHHTSAVLKGGSFSSLPGLLYPSYRGRDAAYCRHNEMGIRCVKNIPIHKLRKALGQPITNKAIY
ncbi:formylglycine-generating enzyme family protein [Bacillus sp. AR2-1]|uniref:formylglycine-generating enzyme family protein n=1 Tax=Bacillus sp. AR2-1 TaxID=2217816 RepID=UPI0011ECA429|nr:formylglycine-generating enzyme family protein [Bacillus sp. AR2-1]KAA0755802.1 formylglycine-generating enzyme family protein [Bacillus sp. AR2-1]